MTIQQFYKVEGRSEEYPTYAQAKMAEVIASLPSLYLSEYQIKPLVAALDDAFSILPRVFDEDEKDVPSNLDDNLPF
jgi:hypothetical protein